MNRAMNTRQKGFTLAEVMVATAIFAMILVAALMVYDRSNKVFKTGVESAEMQQNTRVAFDRMVSDLRMAGFDYDRDGIPTSAGEAQQPDEQIEYAGVAAIGVRANLNYDDLASEGGRIKDLESPNSNFPIVTTANDEIVTYALVSADSSKNTDKITFYADVTDGSAEKRQAYEGGSAEDEVNITGVDLCDNDLTKGCENPPYTLYRFTLNDDGTPNRVPLANNIRSLKITYYTDLTGLTVHTVASAGAGKFDPDDPATRSGAERTSRARIRSMKIELVGLNENPDLQYTSPTETIASIKNRRQYKLETLVSPRNLGKHGMRELSSKPPGAPTLKSICTGYCGGVKISWEAPAASPSFGDVESYYVLWDTDIAGASGPNPTYALGVGLATSYVLTGLDPDTNYRFSVAASNSAGTANASTTLNGIPKNTTTPEAPSGVTATNTDNKIVISWTAPTKNVSPSDKNSCGATAAPDPGEFKGYEIWRDTNASFDPLAAGSTAEKVATASGGATSYTDSTAAACINYYYRVRIVEHCNDDPSTQNTSPAQPLSVFAPAVGTPAVTAITTSTATPTAPATLQVLPTSACSSGTCTVNLQFPEVTTDTAGQTLAIAQYQIDITQNGVPMGPRIAERSTGLIDGGSVLDFPVTGLTQNDSGGVPYTYIFTVKAMNCGFLSAASPTAKYPSCNFASGGTMVVALTGAYAGSGTAAAPFEATAPQTLTFSTSNNFTLKKVTAKAYNMASGAFVSDLGTVTGPSTTLSMGWPSGTTDGVKYRVAYEVTDNNDCVTNNNVYIEEVSVGCPFVTPATLTVKMPHPPAVTIALKNNTSFLVTLKKFDITWNPTLGISGRTVTVTSVTLPGITAPSRVNATLSPAAPNASGTFTANVGIGAAKLFESDTSGNYTVVTNFSVQANKDFEGNPFTGVVASYTLGNDTTVRTCTIYP